MRMRDLTIVKLGGSLAGTPDLAAWLDVLAGCGGSIVIVPGGGPFADAVRRAQAEIGFDDAAAHHMALLAMEQFGRALASRRGGLRLAASVAAIRRALRTGDVPIWSPAAMVLAARDIPASWDVTSDSLAAWLAGRVGARRLFLVKHHAPGDEALAAADLAAQGIVDAAFPQFLAASGAAATIVAAHDFAAAATALRSGGLPGPHIDLRNGEATGLLSPWPKPKRRAGAGR